MNPPLKNTLYGVIAGMALGGAFLWALAQVSLFGWNVAPAAQDLTSYLLSLAVGGEGKTFGSFDGDFESIRSRSGVIFPCFVIAMHIIAIPMPKWSKRRRIAFASVIFCNVALTIGYALAITRFTRWRIEKAYALRPDLHFLSPYWNEAPQLNTILLYWTLSFVLITLVFRFLSWPFERHPAPPRLRPGSGGTVHREATA